MEAVETIEHKGHRIDIHYDEHCDKPYEDDYVNLYSFHRSYTIDKHNYESMQEVVNDAIANKCIAFPVRAYIHSGIALSLSSDSYPFNDCWDSGWFGIIVLDPSAWEIKRVKGWKTKMHTLAKSIVSSYNEWLSGECYGYMIEGELSDDSCWGYLGDEGREEMIKEAKSIIDYAIEQKRKEHFFRIKQWIKSKVPIIYRNPIQYA